MRLITLGGLALSGSAFRHPKPLVLLAYLALEGSVARRRLAELFWPGGKDPGDSLTTTLRRLRKAGPDLVVATDGRLEAGVSCDAVDLLGALDEGRLAEAAALYAGRFLDGLPSTFLEQELETWLYATREFLAARVRSAHLALAEGALEGGDARASGGHAKRAYLLPGAPEPEPETFVRLYRVLHRAGDALAGEVRREAAAFGIAVEAPAPRPSEPATPTDEGRATPVPSLPVSLTSFVGRRAELADLGALLGAPGTRLLTLRGVGGVGKTRFALEVARALRERGTFPGGVVFVPLENVARVEGVPAALAQALGVGGRGERDPLERVAAAIGDRRLLLVLDNLEHLLEGAPLVTGLLRACANLTVLATSRERLNVTGELLYPVEGLRLPEEGDAPETVEASEAVRLFLARAKAADLRFTLDAGARPAVAAICRSLGGVPLAIELAAALVRLLPVEDLRREVERNLDVLSSRARDGRERHRSLRAAFEHSWALLSPREREVFASLSTFRGAFRREAAREVALASIPVLASLVDKSLVAVTPDGRYDLHPLLQQYAGEKLALDADAKRAAEARHWHYYSELLRDLGTHRIAFGESREQTDALLQARSNVLHALRLIDPEQLGGPGHRIEHVFAWAWGVSMTFTTVGDGNAAREALEEGLRLSREGRYPDGEVHATQILGSTLLAVGDLRASLEYYERVLALYARYRDALGPPQLERTDPLNARNRKHDHHNHRVAALGNLALALWLLGEPERALARTREALEASANLTHADQLAAAWQRSGYLHGFRREWEACAAHIARGWRFVDTQEVEWGGLRAWVFEGRAWAERGEVERGLARIEAALAHYRDRQWQLWRPMLLVLRAEVERLAERPADALRTVLEALTVVDRDGEHLWEPEAHRLEGELRLEAGAPRAEAEACLERALAVARGQGARFLELRAATSLARLWAEGERRVEAQALLAGVYARFEEGFDTPDLEDAAALLGTLAPARDAS